MEKEKSIRHPDGVEARKKVLIITYYWPPSGGAGVQRWLKFVKYLPEFGWEPVVLTVDENKASYPVVDATLSGEIAPGIKIYKTDSFEPLNILTKITGNKPPHGGFANKNKENFSQKVLRFVRGNLFLPDARRGWVKHAYKKAKEIIREEKIDTVIISSPPHSSQLIGLKLKKQFPFLKWIADLRDPWTDIYYYRDLFHTWPAAKLDARYERQVLEEADDIIVVSNYIRRSFCLKSNRISEAKIHVIPNGFDEADFPEGVNPESTVFTISYIGTITGVYNPETLFKSIYRLAQSRGNIQLQFVGSVAGEVMDMLRKSHLLDICRFVSHVPHEEAINYMQRASILLLVIPDSASNKGILTGKLFEYMAAGRPVLYVGPTNGDAANIVRETNIGMISNYGDEELIYKHLVSFYDKFAADNLKAESGNTVNYSRRSLTKNLAGILDRISGRNKS